MAISLNTEQLFTKAVSNLGSLAVEGLEKNEQLRLCKETRGYLLELAAKTEKAVGQLNLRNQEFERQLQRLHTEQVAETKRQQELREEATALEAKIAGYKSRETDLSRELERKESELQTVQAKIREQESMIRSMGIGVLLTGGAIGLGGAFVAAEIGQLHEQQDNMQRKVSGLRDDQRRLRSEKRGVEETLERKKEEARGLERDLDRLRDRISVQDRQIKECGANLTKVRNLVIELREMMEKYRFLGHRVEEIRDAVELDILDMNDVIGAKKQLEAIQQSEVSKRF